MSDAREMEERLTRMVYGAQGRRASVAVSTMSLMRRLSGGRPPRPTALAS